MTRSTCYANIRITCGEGDPSFLCREKELALHQQQKGAEASAAAYTICETAKANGLNVYRYLEHILTEPPKLADEKGSIDPARLDDLLPWSDKLPAQCHKPRR